MASRKLEEITQNEDGRWIKVSDGTIVYPEPRGKPIAKIMFKFHTPYDIVRREAKKQKLWEEANAFDNQIYDEPIFSGYGWHGSKLLGAHLFKI